MLAGMAAPQLLSRSVLPFKDSNPQGRKFIHLGSLAQPESVGLDLLHVILPLAARSDVYGGRRIDELCPCLSAWCLKCIKGLGKES